MSYFGVPTRNGLAIGLGTVAGLSANIAAPTGILRAVSPANRLVNNTLSVSPAYVLHCAGRYQHYVGSGDLSEIRLCLNNFIMGTTNISNPGNTLTVESAYIEMVSPAQSVQVLFAGSASKTLTDGEYDVVSDAVLPSAFGLTKFDRGAKFYVRIEVSIPNTGAAVLPIIRNQDDNTTASNYWNPASGSLNNISGTGALVWTGSKTSTRGYSPIVLGKFVSGDPRTWLGIGDSIFDGVGDTLATSESVGNGYFSRSVFGTAPTTTAIGGINTGESSGKVDAWVGSGGTTPRAPLFALTKYCSGAVDEYGTNAFDSTANFNASQMNAVWNLEPALWTNLRSNASTGSGSASYKIVRSQLLARTSTPTGNTPADQTQYGVKWEVGGNADDFNGRIDTALTATTLDAVLNTVFIRGDTDIATTYYHRWANGLLDTADGTHPTSALHKLLAAALRSVIVAM